MAIKKSELYSTLWKFATSYAEVWMQANTRIMYW